MVEAGMYVGTISGGMLWVGKLEDCDQSDQDTISADFAECTYEDSSVYTNFFKIRWNQNDIMGYDEYTIYSKKRVASFVQSTDLADDPPWTLLNNEKEFLVYKLKNSHHVD